MSNNSSNNLIRVIRDNIIISELVIIHRSLPIDHMIHIGNWLYDNGIPIFSRNIQSVNITQSSSPLQHDVFELHYDNSWIVTIDTTISICNTNISHA